MQIGERTGALTCPRCLRGRDEAIAEQLSLRKDCGDEKCVFHDLIKQALTAVKTVKFCYNCGTAYIGIDDTFCYNCGCKKCII